MARRRVCLIPNFDGPDKGFPSNCDLRLTSFSDELHRSRFDRKINHRGHGVSQSKSPTFVPECPFWWMGYPVPPAPPVVKVSRLPVQLHHLHRQIPMRVQNLKPPLLLA